MTTAETPTPAVVPPNGILLTVDGKDTDSNDSTLGITSPAITISDPSGVFTLTPAADGLSATLIPNPGVVGVAAVTFNGTATNDDGSTGGPLTCEYDGQELPGNAVSVSFTATDLPAPVPEALTVTPASVTGTAGAAVTETLVPAGGSGEGYTYASADLVNVGLAIDSSGNITGTGVAGSATITVADSAGNTVSVPVTVS